MTKGSIVKKQSIVKMASSPQARQDLSVRTYKTIFLLPAAAIVLGLSIFPLFFSLGIAFTNWHFARHLPIQFIGLANWVRLAADSRFWVTLRNSVLYVATAVPVEYIIGLVLALCLNERIRGKKLFRVFFTLPLMISPVAVGVIIGKMTLSENIGPLNDIITRLGGQRIPWLSDPVLAFLSLVSVDVWQWTPFMMLVLLAGVSSIPQEPYEAAKVDGASRWQAFRYITFPLLLPVSVTVILVRALEVFKIIDIIKVVTGGGPGQTTESATLLVYSLAVTSGNVAYAAAASYALMIMAVAFGTIFLIIVRRASRDFE